MCTMVHSLCSCLMSPPPPRFPTLVVTFGMATSIPRLNILYVNSPTAGIFISVSLAARLLDPHIWELCKDGWDRVRRWNSITLFERIYGCTAAIRHAVESDGYPWTPETPPLAQLVRRRHCRAGIVARACGYECVFQRFIFPGENLVLSNGFSIVEFLGGGVRDIDLDAVEKTWEEEEGRFSNHIWPLREVIEDGEKQRY